MYVCMYVCMYACMYTYIQGVCVCIYVGVRGHTYSTLTAAHWQLSYKVYKYIVG